MGTPLTVLLVEDSAAEAELVVRALVAGGYAPTFERVATAEDMGAALERRAFDAVIADQAVPAFGAPAALALLRRRSLDVPFLVVSGVAGEDVAVAAIKAGAHDFISKSRLGHLPSALARELGEARARVEHAHVREQLLISERMATAGTLAAGLTHEINNPLAVVAANLELLAGTLAKTRDETRDVALGDAVAEAGGAPPARGVAWLRSRLTQLDESLRDAREATARIGEVVRAVKLFSVSRDEGSGPVDVRAVVESSVRLAWNEIRHRARLRKDLADVPPVEANEGRLGLVLLNLLANAAQAISEGRAGHNEIRVTTRLAGADRVAIEVRDTGAGIPPELIGRIFEPFFTTKPIGTGTGLGLAICHRVVADAGGVLSVESHVGQGSSFRVVLPVSRQATVSAAAAHLGAARRAQVLLVDDEPAVCKAIQRMLSLHHDVTATSSGREALDRVAAGERFDVIVSDLMMPEVTGMDLHEELARRAPEQARRMVFLTGGAFTPRAREFLEAVPNPRVDKPFELRELLATIAAVL
jgi:signal transduction histidine kinase